MFIVTHLTGLRVCSTGCKLDGHYMTARNGERELEIREGFDRHAAVHMVDHRLHYD